jgi:prepilin-type processing-associated H-X9-DG protein
MGYPQLSMTWSRFDSALSGSLKRGAVDHNFSYADGHVARFDNITLNAGNGEPDGDRMTWVSMFSEGYGGDRQIVPKP